MSKVESVLLGLLYSVMLGIVAWISILMIFTS